MINRSTVVFKYSSASSITGEAMSIATKGSSGSLHAEVIEVKMDINDDDEDVVISKISITNEAPVPMGGLDVSVITHLGAKHHSQEGVTSLGPGIQRDWTFEFPLDSGEWTFVLSGSSDEIKMGPFAFDFEYSATQGRKLSSNIGSSMFTGAFDLSLGDFGKVREREMIDSSKVVMTSYSAENSEGGETIIKSEISESQTELSSNPENDDPVSPPSGPPTPPTGPPTPPEPPASPPTPPKSPPPSPPSEPSSPPKVPSGPSNPPPNSPPDGPPSGPPTPPSSGTPTGPPSGPPTPPPSGTPTGPPKGPPSGPPTPPPSGPPEGPPGGPPSGPPSGPPTPPPSGAPTGPPTGPPGGPPTPPAGPSGPPTGPPSGPPTGPPGSPESDNSKDVKFPPESDI